MNYFIYTNLPIIISTSLINNPFFIINNEFYSYFGRKLKLNQKYIMLKYTKSEFSNFQSFLKIYIIPTGHFKFTDFQHNEIILGNIYKTDRNPQKNIGKSQLHGLIKLNQKGIEYMEKEEIYSIYNYPCSRNNITINQDTINKLKTLFKDVKIEMYIQENINGKVKFFLETKKIKERMKLLSNI